MTSRERKYHSRKRRRRIIDSVFREIKDIRSGKIKDKSTNDALRRIGKVMNAKIQPINFRAITKEDLLKERNSTYQFFKLDSK